MDKGKVAEILVEIGTLLELKGENPFKTRAYGNAARALENLTEPLSTLVAEARLGAVPGIGEAIEKKVTELVTTGRLKYYEELKASIPAGLVEMLQIPGLGPKKVKAMHDKLGIESVEQLEAACQAGKVAALDGFGEKTQAKILEGIAFKRTYAARHHLDDALAVAEPVLELLRQHRDVIRCSTGGSLRRWRETIGDIDFLASSKKPAEVIDFFTTQEGVLSVSAKGDTKASVILTGGIQADLRVVSDEEYPFALAYFTGSKEHNIVMRQRAIARGLRLNEYGLFRSKEETRDPKLRVPCKTEEDIFVELGLAYVPPELREDHGEFAAAEQGKLPKLIDWTDLRGALHNHSTWSDGHQTLDEIADQAQELGLEYWAVTDHSRSSFQAHGLEPARLREQLKAIAVINELLADEGSEFRLLTGSEVDILGEGKLDFSDDLLAELDVVVASVHAGFSKDEAEMTKRIIKAVENPHVRILGHLTGGLLLEREPYAVNVQAVIDACAETGTWIELNCNPYRLDLDWRHWPYAKSKGVKCVINPDAHRQEHFGFLRLGAGVARKGWLEKGDVMNTLGSGKLKQALGEKRGGKIPGAKLDSRKPTRWLARPTTRARDDRRIRALMLLLIVITKPQAFHMTWIVQNLWLIPALPLLAAGLSALAKRPARTFAASLAIGSMVLAFCLSCAAFAQTLHDPAARFTHNFDWFALGETTLKLGWVLDPITAAMLVMITFVGTLIFIFSIGYMAHDENFTRFFCFLSLFAAAMLGLVIANSLLLLFMCWELVGLASYLLIGFWYHKPGAAAAAKKAFITTRIGDVFFFLGLLWLYAETGTLLFYDNGNGCLEQSALMKLVGASIGGGMAVSTAIALLIFCGAVGKSGQVPLHVWLPDAMEGPTPVSALIHAATMVAAGVFLIARVFPLMAGTMMHDNMAGTGGQFVLLFSNNSPALQVVTWVGAITAIFAALVAVAQTDIKRILAYSTVSQLGFMFVGLGTGGVAVGMFHLLTHAFFKALLFLGAGSVIHGCHEEQDIRRMGGLRKLMPVTFATYAIGMMALSGVPLFFSGFWSKDEILHAAWLWQPSKWPLLMGFCGAFLTAFYMTRQMWFVFFAPRSSRSNEAHSAATEHHAEKSEPHESPPVMTIPLGVLAVCAILLSVFGTPVWPWFHSYLSGHSAHASASIPVDTLLVMFLSAVVALGGIWVGWRFYSRRAPLRADEPDPLEKLEPEVFGWMRGKFFIDELYEISVLRWNAACARAARWLDETVWENVVRAVSLLTVGLSWLNRLIDEFVVNLGFDKSCGAVRSGSRLASLWQNGQVQRYLRMIGLALALFGVLFIWGCR